MAAQKKVETTAAVRAEIFAGFAGLRGQIKKAEARLVDLSYERHDGRELKLMLEGVKPLSFFMYPDAEADFHESNILGKFSRYVKSGRINQFEDRILYKDICLIIRAYTLPGEDWRASALFCLQRSFVACKTRVRWSEGMERILGSLLGYEDWQNDEYVEKNISDYG